MQALTDVAIGLPRQRDEAVEWIISKDFLEVCEAAEAQPEALRTLVYSLLDTDDRDMRITMIARIKARLNGI